MHIFAFVCKDTHFYLYMQVCLTLFNKNGVIFVAKSTRLESINRYTLNRLIDCECID